MSYIGSTHTEHLIDNISDLTLRAIEEIQKRIVKQGKRNAILQHLHARNDKERIAAWRLDLVRILQVFNVRSVVSA